MGKPTIALAQSASKRGDIIENIEKHHQLIALAAKNDAQLIIFPELSLTGYELDLAKTLAFTTDDKRLNSLRALSEKHNMVIIVGAPILGETGLHIGAFILFPDHSVSVYTKYFLHPGEEKIFTPGSMNQPIKLGQELISIAICADISNSIHVENASKAGSTIYLASVFITDAGYEIDADILQGYARKHSLQVMMANYSGESGGYKSAGRSAVWSDSGSLITQCKGAGEELIIATKENNIWAGNTLSIS